MEVMWGKTEKITKKITDGTVMTLQQCSSISATVAANVAATIAATIARWKHSVLHGRKLLPLDFLSESSPVHLDMKLLYGV